MPRFGAEQRHNTRSERHDQAENRNHRRGFRRQEHVPTVPPGEDYNELREVRLADPRISRDHAFVYPDNRGFSGKCLPKDVSAVLRSSAEHGFAPPLLESVMDINEAHRADDPTYAPYRRKGKRHGWS